MFERLFRQPRPWQYGHLYLPEGSKNLGNPEFELEPGSKVGGQVVAAHANYLEGSNNLCCPEFELAPPTEEAGLAGMIPS